MAWDFLNNSEKDTFGNNILTNGDFEDGLTGWTYLDATPISGQVGAVGSSVLQISAGGYAYQIETPDFDPPQLDVSGFFYISDVVGDYKVNLYIYVRYTDLTEDKYTLPINASLNDDYQGLINGDVVNWFLLRDTIELNPDKVLNQVRYIIENNSLSGVLYVDNASLRLDNNVPVSRSAYTNTPMIDKYGIDPVYLDYFKNMIHNSSFEIYDSDATPTPTYWTGTGLSDPNSSFYGSYSCKLEAGQSIETDSAKYINPSFYDNEQTRVSFYRKLGQMKLEVYDNDNAAYFTLTDTDGNTGSSITFDATSNWQNSRCSAQFDPTEHGACTSLKVVITNVHGSQTGYVDAVMLQPDYTGKWPQIYKNGPNSDLASLNEIIISDTAPADTTKLWYDIS